ncbi:cytochrome c oxidase subunit II [Rhizobium halophilum]|uniref:cytochrome c oxidase subunit II n=1 Tax=Rhizobium halophilum TaxID=2846852 RepID=UPI001EFD369D|nr:cytochrome c oxidase subunit II [Rhizobium halophilum]MCF6369882.1 cytochrome c oxidase subunit II [Rhizobium halophilum]
MRLRLLRLLSSAPFAFLLSGCQGIQSALDPASRDARLVAELSWWMFTSAVFIYIVTIGLLAVGAGLFRGRKRLSFRSSTTLVILGGVCAPIIAIIAIGVSGVAIGDETEGAREAGTALTIEVVGKQWWWELRYLDEAGEVIAVTANELHLPVGERARLELLSDNVIHSFWAPNLQGKTDAIPGRRNVLFAEPAVEGVWRGQCAEFCGKQHTLMGFMVVAEPRDEFNAWLERQASDALAPPAPGLDVFLDLGCGGCHTIRGTPADGQKGPDLTHLASRRTIAAATLPNSRGNLGGWITDTHEVKPGALMPSFIPEPQDLHDLLDYLEALH